MEETFEYELLNIEWTLNYDFDHVPTVKLVKDDSGEQEFKQEARGKEKSTPQKVRCISAPRKT